MQHTLCKRGGVEIRRSLVGFNLIESGRFYAHRHYEFIRYLVDDTEAAAAYTLKLLQDRELWRELGVNAHETVRQRFLFPTMILDYLKALERAQTDSSARVSPERVPITISATGKELVAS